MAKKPDPKTVQSGPLAGMFSISSISRWVGDGMAPLRNWVQYGDAGKDDRAGTSSADTKSLTATTAASKLKILCTRITELEMWGTISKIRAKRDREYYEGRLGRNPVGRQVGSGVDLSHHLDRIEKIIDDGDARFSYSVGTPSSRLIR